jgi:hypothetical protein
LNIIHFMLHAQIELLIYFCIYFYWQYIVSTWMNHLMSFLCKANILPKANYICYAWYILPSKLWSLWTLNLAYFSLKQYVVRINIREKQKLCHKIFCCFYTNAAQCRRIGLKLLCQILEKKTSLFIVRIFSCSL